MFWTKNSNVIDLAKTIFSNFCVATTPILADAMEEAGCDDKKILADCRTMEKCYCSDGAVFWYRARGPEMEWVYCPLCNNEKTKYIAIPTVLNFILQPSQTYIDEYGWNLKHYSWRVPVMSNKNELIQNRVVWLTQDTEKDFWGSQNHKAGTPLLVISADSENLTVTDMRRDSRPFKIKPDMVRDAFIEGIHKNA